MIEVKYYGYDSDKGVVLHGDAYINPEDISSVQEWKKPEILQTQDKFWIVGMRNGTNFLIDTGSKASILNPQNEQRYIE